ncbi:SMI1/KNR4 family protein [Polycladomyces sp. WAk]|uniref:SMI1/KNR4 family protein n=1 Tax=Polycladomyces zharkentensis TaxID=2807616 RepID=A0ABS2WM01_9BACL|nr:SMI1/KNR4 family protein [Polycladomyces sp. WAk]MBN2910320.1 SMI1/KNR4 family protein [Polycladomyces sp. WAk]
MTKSGFTVGPTDEHVINEIKRSLHLSEKLLSWYRKCAPRIEELDFGGNPIHLYEPEELVDLQINFSHDLYCMKKNPDWKEDWIVIADKGLDPFIFDQKTEKIYHALHGQGHIRLREIAPCLEDFIETLSILTEICYLKYHGQFLNDGWEFDKKILQEIEGKLSTFLPKECVKNWVMILE